MVCDPSCCLPGLSTVAAPALEELLPLVVEGIYMEPRCEATKSPDSDFTVVWIPGATRESATHKLKTITHGLGLVRLKQPKSGVYIPHLMDFLVPKLLQEWGWPGKPLQPSRGSAEGGAWEVASSDDPPQSVLPAYGRDVLINLLKDKAQPERQPTIIAPKRAQDHLRTQKPASSSTTTDPELQPQHDPWAKHVPLGTAATPPKHYDSLAKKLLSASFQQQFQTDASNTANVQGLEQRMQKMEVGLTELHAHSAHVNQWMQEAGNRMAAQDEQLQQVALALQQAQTDIVAVRSEVHSSTTTWHQAMQSSFTNMKQEIVSEMASTMDQQMTRFETLLTAKKPCQE